jgi:RNA polymerase sigma-70 factor (ECF subfamily)
VYAALANREPRSAADEDQSLDFTALYSKYVQQVARWVARLGGPGFDVEDAVQDIFLDVQRTLPKFRGEASVPTWLFRITTNAVNRKLRRARRWAWLGKPADEIAERMPAAVRSADEQLESHEASEKLYRALDRMTERYRSLVVLFELEELSGEEIARLVGVKLPTVWVQLHRARAQLLKALEAEEKGEVK